MRYCIYEIRNLVNGKTYYGKHREHTKRTIENDSYSGSGKLLHLAYKKYGRENFKKSFLIIGDFSKEEINSFETCIIRIMRLCGKAEYNLADGGEGGGGNKFWTEEGRKQALQKISIKTRDWNLNHKERCWGNKHNTKGTLGFKFSEESKRKLSECHKGNRNGSFGTHWWTNGLENIKSNECPEGFKKGRKMKGDTDFTLRN
jgi:hypothetical protein